MKNKEKCEGEKIKERRKKGCLNFQNSAVEKHREIRTIKQHQKYRWIL